MNRFLRLPVLPANHHSGATFVNVEGVPSYPEGTQVSLYVMASQIVAVVPSSITEEGKQLSGSWVFIAGKESGFYCSMQADEVVSLVDGATKKSA